MLPELVDAACYADRVCASRRWRLPAFCHKPAANRPHRAASDTLGGALMETVNRAARTDMKDDTNPRDTNAELHCFESLRTSLALGALLLGLLLGIH